MGAGRKSQTFSLGQESQPSSSTVNCSAKARHLWKDVLAGVIFGCTHETIAECLSKQIFGLPAQHFSYVKNIQLGLPLFLFNYSDRKLHGIFEAASHGKMNINPHGWSSDGSEKTRYPAQVRTRMVMQFQPLSEKQYKPIIKDNYYSDIHFWFELDRIQASQLVSLFKSSPASQSSFSWFPHNTPTWKPPPPRRENEEVLQLVPHANIDHSKLESGFPKNTFKWKDLFTSNHDHATETVIQNEEHEGSLELSELQFSLSTTCVVEQTTWEDQLTTPAELADDQTLEEDKSSTAWRDQLTIPGELADEQTLEEDQSSTAWEDQSNTAHEWEEVQLSTATELEDRLDTDGESWSDQKSSSTSCADKHTCDDHAASETLTELLDEPKSGVDQLVFLLGGFNGVSCLSDFDCYSLSSDTSKSLNPMNLARSNASSATLNDEIYIFGGGDSHSWYDTVESYNTSKNEWATRPSLIEKKGSLAGCTLHSKIFAIGGGNGVESFSDIEMFDPALGYWIHTRSMLHKRFAPATAELNGVIYVVGGYDGNNYLKSAERFDPREVSCFRVRSMNTQRACHSLVVLNEKLYALGGFDGTKMVSSVEVYDPRNCLWSACDEMNQSRGYSYAAVMGNKIYVFGGVCRDKYLDTVECYTEGQGWEVTNLKGVGKRCLFAAAVL